MGCWVGMGITMAEEESTLVTWTAGGGDRSESAGRIAGFGPLAPAGKRWVISRWAGGKKEGLSVAQSPNASATPAAAAIAPAHPNICRRRGADCAIDPSSQTHGNRGHQRHPLGQHSIELPLKLPLFPACRTIRQVGLETGRFVGREPSAQVFVELVTSRSGHGTFLSGSETSQAICRNRRRSRFRASQRLALAASALIPSTAAISCGDSRSQAARYNTSRWRGGSESIASNARRRSSRTIEACSGPEAGLGWSSSRGSITWGRRALRRRRSFHRFLAIVKSQTRLALGVPQLPPAAPRAQKRFLRKVFRLLTVSRQPQREAVDPRQVLVHKRCSGLRAPRKGEEGSSRL